MNDIFERIWQRKFVFLSTFFVVFTLSYLVLIAIDFVPEPPATQENTEEAASSEESADSENEQDVDTEESIGAEVGLDQNEGENEDVSSLSGSPVSINIEKLGKTVAVLNPTSRTIADLDASLLEGVVRHPDSATLNQEGNVFILGHSSYLPNVLNRNFQAFNGIQNLEWGDSIEVFSEDSVYEYRVEKVYRARAQDVTVPIAGTGNMLTLATCNSFGSVDDRYIVEAKRVDVKGL